MINVFISAFINYDYRGQLGVPHTYKEQSSTEGRDRSWSEMEATGRFSAKERHDLAYVFKVSLWSLIENIPL